MVPTCEYCRSTCVEGALKCASCGAPLKAATSDHRFCPHCHRRLLSLSSPACNYCGRALPESYVKAREATLRRINEMTATASVDTRELDEFDRESDDAMKRALKILFKFPI